MQHIKSYMDKIEAYLKKDKPKGKGAKPAPEDANFKTVVSMVQGIRQAREEHLNGSK